MAYSQYACIGLIKGVTFGDFLYMVPKKFQSESFSQFSKFLGFNNSLFAPNTVEEMTVADTEDTYSYKLTAATHLPDFGSNLLKLLSDSTTPLEYIIKPTTFQDAVESASIQSAMEFGSSDIMVIVKNQVFILQVDTFSMDMSFNKQTGGLLGTFYSSHPKRNVKFDLDELGLTLPIIPGTDGL